MATTAVLVVAVVILAALLALYTVPVKSVSQTGVEWDGGTGSWTGTGIANGTVESPARLLCPPADATGNTTFSFVWASTRSHTNATVVLDYGFGVPIHTLVLYHAANATQGGYSATVGPASIICQGLTFAGFFNAQPYTVTWTFQFVYNYTAREPLL